MFVNVSLYRGHPGHQCTTEILVPPGSLRLVCVSLFFFIPILANLVQGLNSTDPAVQERTIAEAEKRLHDQETSREEESKTMVNRTVINTRASVRAFFPFEVKAVCNLGLLNKTNSHSLPRRKNFEQYLQVCYECDFVSFTSCLTGMSRRLLITQNASVGFA